MFICSTCGKTYPDDAVIWRCTCGEYLNYEGTERLRKEDIITDKYSMWRYEKALPLNLAAVKTQFEEGLTPLVKTKWEGIDVLFKVDYLMPTGSFKDRGSAVLINYLHNLGVKKVLDDSSGNAGASIAAYSAAAGIECDIYVPAYTSEGKLVQIAMYGARLNKITGSREDVTVAAMEASHGAFYASHNWHPMFIEGTKTLAYEIWEQMGWKVPDNIVVPVGMGSSLLGFYKGFKELYEVGEIDRLPRLFGIQTANCDPLYEFFNKGELKVNKKDTIAEGIACAKPIRVKEMMEAVKDTKGSFLAVSEEDILAALRTVTSLGFYIEPTSAVALAGASRLIQEKVISPEQSNVILLTGNGLKATDKIGKYFGFISNGH